MVEYIAETYLQEKFSNIEKVSRYIGYDEKTHEMLILSCHLKLNEIEKSALIESFLNYRVNLICVLFSSQKVEPETQPTNLKSLSRKKLLPSIMI